MVAEMPEIGLLEGDRCGGNGTVQLSLLLYALIFPVWQVASEFASQCGLFTIA